MVKNFDEPEDIEFQDGPRVLLDDDWYLATFENYELLKKVPDQWHPEGIDKLMLWFRIAAKDAETDEDVQIASRVNRSWGPRSGLKNVVAQMTGRDVNEPFPMRLKELRGIKVELLISTTTNGMYNNIDKIRKPNTKQSTMVK